MLSNIRNRLILIAILVVASVWSLVPKNITIRERGPDGRMRDTTVRRVPLKRGLDLQGGIHLALEIDQSLGPVADPAGALERALTVIRSRVDEFGVEEPLIQKVGNERIVVELAGVDDTERAKGITRRTAFLEWRITDMQNLFRDALPTIDAALARAGVQTTTGAATPAALETLLGADTAGQVADTGGGYHVHTGPARAAQLTAVPGSDPGRVPRPRGRLPQGRQPNPDRRGGTCPPTGAGAAVGI